MRVRASLTLAVLFLLLPLPVSDAQQEGTGASLVLLFTEEESGPALAAQGFFLVAPVPDGYLALMSENHLAMARSRGLPHLILDPPDAGDNEYVIAFDVESNYHEMDSTLFRGDGYWIQKVPRRNLEQTIGGISEFQLVFRRPLRFVNQAWTEEMAAGVDRDIQAMVGAVNGGLLKTRVLELQDFGSRHSTLPGGRHASRFIRNYFRRQGYTNVSLHDYNEWSDNVLCVKRGEVNPHQYVVLAAHYDSDSSDIYDAPGADDNATGTAGIMEAARVMAGYDFHRSIIFIAFSGEEEGLVGSESWASEAAELGMDIVGVVNLDMLCYVAEGDAEDVDIVTNKSSRPLRNLAKKAIATYVPELARVRGVLVGASSDHASFWQNGYRAITFIEDARSFSPYIHSPNDIVGLSANNFGFMLKNVRAAVATVATLAGPFRADTQRQ